MRSSSVRHIVHLELTLVGFSPQIRRTIAVDRGLMLGELHRIVSALFASAGCTRHIFTDSLHNSSWSHQRRRWGDRWTMIDFRDPHVIDETSVSIENVLQSSPVLFHRHTCSYGWTVEITATDPTASSGQPVGPIASWAQPAARILDGERRTPFPCSRSGFEYEVMLGIIADPSHPHHDALAARIDATVGPWGEFDPESFDVALSRRAIEDLFHPRAAPARLRVTSLIDVLPAGARPGLRRHIESMGLERPSVVTDEDVRALTRDWRWLIERAAAPGIPFIEGAVDSNVARDAVAELGISDERVERMVAAARSWRLAYVRNGRLVANKDAVAAARTPHDFWLLLVSRVGNGNRRDDLSAAALLMLSIADGSLGDPAAQLTAAASAFEAISARQGGFADVEGYWSSEGRGAYGYREERGGCPVRCECPALNDETWHDIAACVIRDAAGPEQSDSVWARPDSADSSETVFTSEWMVGSWDGDERVSVPERIVVTPADRERALLAHVVSTVELFTLLGLSRVNGSWDVPTALREFARAVLSARTPRSYSFSRSYF